MLMVCKKQSATQAEDECKWGVAQNNFGGENIMRLFKIITWVSITEISVLAFTSFLT
jgi:hypothetical protein